MTQPPDDRAPELPDPPAGPVTPATSGPIISAATVTAPSGGTETGQPGQAAAPLVGWELPREPAPAPGADDYVIASVGARIVAYLIDALLVTIVPTILSFFLIDFETAIRRSIAVGTGATASVPVTLDIVLVTIISLAIQFIYFVGFWTSGGRATLGMRGLKLRVVDARTGGVLSLAAASKRWIALGAPLALLAFIPVLQTVSGLLGFAWLVVLFFTVVSNDLRQGLQDRWAGSVVIRSVTSGDAATAVGCIVFGLLAIGLTIAASAIALALLGPELEDILIDIGNSI